MGTICFSSSLVLGLDLRNSPFCELPKMSAMGTFRGFDSVSPSQLEESLPHCVVRTGALRAPDLPLPASLEGINSVLEVPGCMSWYLAQPGLTPTSFGIHLCSLTLSGWGLQGFFSCKYSWSLAASAPSPMCFHLSLPLSTQSHISLTPFQNSLQKEQSLNPDSSTSNDLSAFK